MMSDAAPQTAPEAILPPFVELADLLEAASTEGAVRHYPLGADWHNGRSTYGGAAAVLAVDALRRQAAGQRPLRSLQVNFVGPLEPGRVPVTVQTLRSGRSVTQARAIVGDPAQPSCLALGVFADGRPSEIPASSPVRPETRAAETAHELRLVPGRTPPFLMHIDTRWVEGNPPHRGGDERHSRIWMRLRDTRPVSPELLAVLFCDAMPSPAMGMVRKHIFAASLSWNLEFLPAAHACRTAGWWRADTELTSSGEGFATQYTTLFAPDGEAVALSHQVVTIYG